MRRFRIHTKTEKTIVFSVVLLVSVVVALLWYVYQAAGATYTWDGGGASSNWSDCDNWTSNTCPGVSDIAKFDGTDTTDSVVDASFGGSVVGINIAAGYTGTITQERNLTIGGSSYSQADGTWKQGTTTFDINDGSFTLSNGTFETGVGTSTIERNFTLDGGTYTASSTRAVVFNADASNGADDSTISCTGELDGSINFSKNSEFQQSSLGNGCSATTSGNIITTGLITVDGTLHIAGDVDIDNEGFVNNGTTTMDGTTFSVERNFTQNGVFDLTSVTIVFDGNQNTDDGTLSCSGNPDGVPNIEIKKLDQFGNFTLASGCTATSTSENNIGGISINGTLNDIGTTMSARYFITVGSTGSLHINGDVDIDYNGTSGYFANNGTTTMQSGKTMYVEQDFTQNGYFDMTDITLRLDASNGNGNMDSTVSCSGDLGGTVIVDKSSEFQQSSIASGCSVTGATSTSPSSITINGTWATQGTDLTAATGLSVGSNGTLRVHGGETLTTPSLSAGATVEYYGAGTYGSLIAGTDYTYLKFTGGGTYNIGSSVTIAGDLISTNGSTFNQTSGTVTLDGNETQRVTGTSTFANLTATSSNKREIRFGAGETTTITGAATLKGDSVDTPLLVVSDVPHTQWKVDLQGTRDLQNLWVRDSNNINATAAQCSPGCRNLRGNTNWNLSEPRDRYRINGNTRVRGGVQFR